MLLEPIVVRVVRKRSCPCIMHAQKESRSKNRSVQNLIGSLAPYAGGHGMTNMLSDPDPIAKSFRRIRGEVRIIHLTMNGFHPGKLEERTNVSHTTGRQECRLTEILGGVGDAVEHMSDATHAEEPQFRGRACAIH